MSFVASGQLIFQEGWHLSHTFEICYITIRRHVSWCIDYDEHHTLNEDFCILMLAVAMECHEINASNKLEELSAGDIVAGIVNGLRRHPFSDSFL